MIYITILLIPLGILIIPSVLVLTPSYKYYKKVYKELPNKTFYLNHNQVHDMAFGKISTDFDFTWFINDNSFKLKNGVYLHNAFYTYLDPYSLYWLIKYRQWFKDNVDIKTLEKY